MDLRFHAKDDSFVHDESNDGLLKSFRTSHIPAIEMLSTDPGSIAHKTNRAFNVVDGFLQKFKEESLNRIMSTLNTPQHLKESNDSSIFFTVGDESIDKELNGGIPRGYLIEVSGKSASGKTNFLVTLSVTIQLPKEFGGLGPSLFEVPSKPSPTDVKTLYIPTESPLPTSRLNQMVDTFSELLKTNGIPEEDVRFFPKSDNVLTTSNPMTNLEEQDHIIRYQLPAMLARDKTIKLVIIDSLTHHPRAELPWYSQADYVTQTCSHLKELGRKYHITIIIANQVTDKPVKGIYSGENDILWKLNTEYQFSWMFGWEDTGILYRQLMKRHGIIDEAGKCFDQLDYLDDLTPSRKDNSSQSFEQQDYQTQSMSESDSNTQDEKQDRTKLNLQSVLKMEKKQMFENTYKSKVSGITTRPAFGLPLLEIIDMRIILSKQFTPILNETLIDEFSEELGIDTSKILQSSQLETEETISSPLDISSQKSQKHLMNSLANNSYLKNYNFESSRTLKCVFGPLIPAGESAEIKFEIWKGGIRKCRR